MNKQEEKVMGNKKIIYIAQFENYYDLKQKDIILNSIRVTTHTLKNIPFDILVAGDNAFRIVPSISDEKFFVKYEYIGEEQICI